MDTTNTPDNTTGVTLPDLVPVPVLLPVVCLYCGSPDDIFEALNTIDERTSGYALNCGLCGGVWTQ